MSLLERAHAHAVRLGHDRIGGEELLLVVLDDGVGHALPGALGISRDVLVWQLEKAPSSPVAGTVDGYPVTAEVLGVPRSSGLVELVVGLLAAGGGAARVLGEHGVTEERVREAHARIWAPFLDENAVWGSSVARGPVDPPFEIDALTSQIAEYRRRKEAAVDAQEYTQAGLIRDKEKEVERRRSVLIREWAATVDPVDLAEAVVSLRAEVAALRRI
ncbi:UvrB/UvrC motif-containing protein [Amycolatopsis keratiniphila]|uniref:ATP-dependent Clp protease ATP-binding subunit ClpC n=1 Tax=Amycolatopsis keratiniphila TaxID=129921 RepID=R4SVR9_9PSEU|nr:UvrB/UvrC motif-containing protein [Amycolatopsis keratiniphila]AGM04251.1 ATP-dependent Clp protease ATP-binding subunit ClpC [Amycolatopsis keratiniphila]